MSFARVQPIADAILYEGYALYPYRASSTKNRHRFLLGSLSPRSWAEGRVVAEPFQLVCECLLEAPPEAAITARARFLHLRAGAWEEASAREVDLGPARVSTLVAGSGRVGFAFGGGAKGDEAAITGELVLGAVEVGGGVYRVEVRLVNTTPLAASAGDAEARFATLASAHVALFVEGGAFVSLLDPAEALQGFAEGCRNAGAWPVLAGEAGSRDLVLCSPIILGDYPAVAPESPGDLFDGTEMDEMLTLRILTLTEDERREAAEGDPRVRALLARTEALAHEDLARLHGAIRSLRTVQAGGVEIGAGARVRLHPRGRSDVFDIALTGQTATVLSVERDYEDRWFVTVAVDVDPGRDLGAAGLPGHRFFFAPEEIEPL